MTSDIRQPFLPEPGTHDAYKANKADHRWLNRHYPRSGVCEDCEARTRTGYAYFGTDPRGHERRRDAYRELCQSCHGVADGRPPIGSSVVLWLRHGTDSTYSNLGCKCADCRAAHAAAHLDYMRRRRAS